MPLRRRRGICAYCQAEGEVTADHVPPRCLFPPATRVNLITVPACWDCNNGFKLDDEYFRLVLSLRADLPESETTHHVRATAFRALGKPEARGLRKSIVAGLKQRSIHTPGGIYLGETKTFKIDYSRLKGTAQRIIVGLFCHFFKTPLPATHNSTVFLADLQKDDSAINHPQVKEILEILGRTGTRRSTSDVLDIWVATAVDDPLTSFWYVRIFRMFGIIGFTAPTDANPSIERDVQRLAPLAAPHVKR